MDEKPLPDELPLDYARRVARLKAEMGRLRLQPPAWFADLPLLAADTAVALGKRILGKPVDCAHAKEMLEALSGQTHHVLTAIAVAAQIGIQVRVSQPWFGSAISANVKFAHISHMAKRKTSRCLRDSRTCGSFCIRYFGQLQWRGGAAAIRDSTVAGRVWNIAFYLKCISTRLSL